MTGRIHEIELNLTCYVDGRFVRIVLSFAKQTIERASHHCVETATAFKLQQLARLKYFNRDT